MNAHARTLHSSPRRLGIMVALVLVGALVAVTVLWAARGNANASESISSDFPSAQPAAPGSEVTTAGDLSELDKTLLAKVRQANLWEAPAGRLAQTHASSEAVKRAGLHLMEGHSKLDSMVRDTAEALNVTIPNEATAEQLALLRQLQNASGAEFDKLFANILRASHGKVFVTIGQVRATTKNSQVRAFAGQANSTVLDHQNALDDTGLVSDATYEDVAAAVAPK
jgi:predicted outer membrane protein